MFCNVLRILTAKQLQKNSVWAALATSLGVTVAIALTFSFLRPYNQSVYAPKLKHADERNAPPPIGKKIWSWIPPLWKTTETELVHHVGMDATLFLRFVRMCVYMFSTISVFCIAILIPTYLTNRAQDIDGSWLDAITPIAVWGDAYWAQVAVAYMITFTVMGFLWWNYRKVLLLRRKYFESEEYQNSLHARTLMVSSAGSMAVLESELTLSSCTIFPRTDVRTRALRESSTKSCLLLPSPALPLPETSRTFQS